MEVQGRKAHFSCQPCSGDGHNKEADGFCQNCKEYLCATCITYHLRFTLSKHHVILDKQSMPLSKQREGNKATCTEICEKHGTEFVKFFCTQHDVVGCGDCMILGHKTCKVDYIPDIADGFVNGYGFSSLVKEVERLKSVVKEMKEKTKNGEKDTSTAYAEAVNSVKQFRTEVDAYLHRMERELLLKCERLREGNDSRVQNITDECHKVEKRLHEIHAQFTTSDDQVTSLFIKAKNSTSCLKEIDQKLFHVGDGPSLQVMKFKKSPDVESMISNSSPLGEIETLDICQPHSNAREHLSDLTPIKSKDIDIKTPSDRTTNTISSISKVNEETLACADWKNEKVKLVDIKLSVIKDEISLRSPCDLTCLPDDQLAVTLVSDKQIQFLSTRGSLSKGHTISVNGNCRGITYSKDKLYVTYEGDPKVEIMTLGGDILQCFKYDQSGNRLFKRPVHVAVTNDASFMYISDSTLLGSVIKLSSSGQVHATYKDVTRPRNVVVCKDGCVLVYDAKQNSLLLLSSDCTKIKVVFEKSEDVRECLAVCYDDQTNTLYLGFYNRNKIRAYTMK